MSKAVLISIQPKWCELIANGRKTIEVRKTRPNLTTPFQCYIYQTKRTWIYNIYSKIADWQQKVIGEFVCDTIITDRTFGHDTLFNAISCMNDAEIAAYCTKSEMYGWHISDLKIYDKPKELNEFKKINRDCWYADLGLAKRDCPECKNKNCFVQRPPQSWCYVERLVGEE